MRELEVSLQLFGEFRLKAQLVTEKAAPYCVRWVRRFLTRPASSEPFADRVQRFCEELEHRGTYADWQIHQAEHALRIYVVNFLHRTDWHRSTVVDERGRPRPLTALEDLRLRIRTRHDSYKTESAACQGRRLRSETPRRAQRQGRQRSHDAPGRHLPRVTACTAGRGRGGPPEGPSGGSTGRLAPGRARIGRQGTGEVSRRSAAAA